MNLMPIFIVGLGNPGKEYQKSPHNLGFEAIDFLKRRWKFNDFQKSNDQSCLISQGKIGKHKIFLVKPLTFMNRSGQAIKYLIKKYKLKKECLWLIHDEIDLPLEKIKIVQNKGSAGHKGVEDIIRVLGTKNFIRFRIGSCPFKKKSSIKEIRSFLLSSYSPKQWKEAKKGIQKTAKAIEIGLTKGIPTAMSRFN